jgi:hypothetical protein
MGEREIDVPLLERLVEIEIDEAAGAQIRIRPRALPAAVNLRPYEELKVEGAMLAGDAARRVLAAAEADDGVSPFPQRGLRAGLARLPDPPRRFGRLRAGSAASGPGGSAARAGRAASRDGPWVLFARRRSDSFILRDRETLKDAVETLEASSELPPPARTLVSGPGDGPADAAWQPLGNQIGATRPGALLGGRRGRCLRRSVLPKAVQTTTRSRSSAGSKPRRASSCRARRARARPTPSPT